MFLNQTRRHEKMLPDPTGARIIPVTVRVKWAVLSVLSTKCPLSVEAIHVLLSDLSYPCSKFAIKHGLHRCEKFGLVEKGRFRYEEGVCRRSKLRAHQHNKWKLTTRGRELINGPRKLAMSRTKEAIRAVMEQATSWLTVSDINVIINSNRATIRRHLRGDPAYKAIKVPGDGNGAMQWALAAADTTHWPNAEPSQGSSQRPRPSKARPKVSMDETTPEQVPEPIAVAQVVSVEETASAVPDPVDTDVTTFDESLIS